MGRRHHHRYHRSLTGQLLGGLLYGYGWFLWQVLRVAGLIVVAALVLELAIVLAVLGLVVAVGVVAWRGAVGVLGYGDRTHPPSGAAA